VTFFCMNPSISSVSVRFSLVSLILKGI
jgi:hypothetical protein